MIEIFTMRNFWWLILFVFMIILIFGLITGETYLKYGGKIKRVENPTAYWLAIFSKIIIIFFSVK